MAIIDVILNLAALLLWFNWRAYASTPNFPNRGVSLLGTLRKAETKRARRWLYLVSLLGLLVMRGLFYAHIGRALNWTAPLELGAITLYFRSDFPARIMAYSFISFLLLLGIVYASLILISVANESIPDADPIQHELTRQLGWLMWAPRWIRLFLPALAISLLWWGLNGFLVERNFVPPPKSTSHALEQALVLSANGLLIWRFPIGLVLFLHIVNSYVYVGQPTFFNYVNQTAKNILKPIRWLPLRLGKIDLAPVVVIAAIFAASDWAIRFLRELYPRLPLGQ